jgi:glyoxylase-like metal-dependent hydrolase (beta-lactamase superfamily II)
MDTTENYRFSVGALRCVALSDGTETCPVESIVKGVAPDQVSAAFRARGDDPSGPLTYYFNVLLVDTGERRVLIDAGWGQGTQRRDGTLVERLRAAGITPADIDTIIFTHGDADHVGGVMTADGRLAFPNAEYVLPADAWAFWTNAASLARWPAFLTEFGRLVLPLIRDRVRVVAAGDEFLPGFTPIPVPGHRPGHTALAIQSNGETLIHLADVVGYGILMERPTWTWPFDFAPEQASADKRLVLGRAVESGALVFGSHLPFPGVGRVARAGEGWRFEPLE